MLYDVQDLGPRPALRLAPFGAGLLFRLMSKWAMFTYSRADHITVIATEFKTNLVDAGVPSRKISVIPNWTDEVCFKPHSGIDARNSFSIPEDPFVVIVRRKFWVEPRNEYYPRSCPTPED